MFFYQRNGDENDDDGSDSTALDVDAAVLFLLLFHGIINAAAENGSTSESTIQYTVSSML